MQDVPEPSAPKFDEALVRVAYVGLCGTDLELFHGSSNYLRTGRTSYPHHFGHEWVGVIDAPPTNPNGEHLRQGTVVSGSTMITCRSCEACRSGQNNLCSRLREVGLYQYAGAVAEYLTMPVHSLTVVDNALDAVPQPRHVLIEPLVTVLEGVAKIEPRVGSRILIIGAGTIGSLAAIVMSKYPVEVDLIDPNGAQQLANLGIARIYSSTSEVNALYDVVWECSGAQSATATLLRNLKPGGVGVLVGVPPADTTINVAEFALNGQQLIGIRHGVDHYITAAEFITKNSEMLDNLIDHVYTLADARQAFARLETIRERPKVVLHID